jgi:hypothetical protein
MPSEGWQAERGLSFLRGAIDAQKNALNMRFCAFSLALSCKRKLKIWAVLFPAFSFLLKSLPGHFAFSFQIKPHQQKNSLSSAKKFFSFGSQDPSKHFSSDSLPEAFLPKKDRAPHLSHKKFGINAFLGQAPS